MLKPTGHFSLSSSVDLVPVDPARICEFLPHVEALLRAASERTGASDFENDIRLLKEGVALLWLAWGRGRIQAVATTEIVTMGGAQHCYITACAGRGSKNWLHLLSGVERYAARNGCKTVRTLARPGWKPLLKDYRPKLVLLQKELT